MEYLEFTRELDTYVDNTLIPAIASNLSGLFPALNFRLNTSGYWYSDTTLTGTQKKGSTVLFAKYNGGRLTIGANKPEEAGIDKYAKPGAKGIDVIELYRALNGNLSYTEAVKQIAEVLGVSLAGYPKANYSYDVRPAEDRDIAKEAFIGALWANTPEAAAALTFLHDKGYSDTEIKEAGIGLATPEVIAHLEKVAPRWYPREAGGKQLAAAHAQGFGVTWKIAVPMYYGCKVDTFNFRTIGTPPEGMPKYKVPAGIKRDIFSGLTTTLRESVILVEGELDALKARINGIPNVVSYGMNYISADKVRNAVARGITKFTIIPDNDTKEGVAATMQAGVVNIESSINNLYEGGATEVYIAPLPMVQAEGSDKVIKDTEEFIAVFGAKVWYNTVRDNKTAAVAYLVDRSFRQFVERGNFSREDRTALLNKLEAILTAPRYDKYSQREEAYAVVRYYLNIPGNSDYFRFTEEGLRKYVEGKRDREAKATREAAYIKDITEAAELAKAGAITLADKKLTDSRSRNYAKNTEAEVGAIFTHPATVEEAEAEIRQLPTGLSTGLYLLTDNGEKQELELKEGVSLLVGARKHGKTTLLCNMALNAAAANLKKWKEGVDTELKKVVFISYEVTYARLLQKLLSIYLNNPQISNNTARSILGYYKGKEDTYFSRSASGNKEGYLDFLNRKDTFYKDYITNGALTIITADKVLDKAGKSLTIENLVAYLDTYLANNEVSLIALDYIQEIASERKYGTRVEELKYIGEVLRNFANTHKLPFLCAAQFNRQIQSLVDLDTKNIGEAGDLERNGVDIIATFNLKELGYIRGSKSPDVDTAENAARLLRYGLNCITDFSEASPQLAQLLDNSNKKKVVLSPIPGKMYIRLIASRYDNFPADVVTDFIESTGFIDIPGTGAIVREAAAKDFAFKNMSETDKARRELEAEIKAIEAEIKKLKKEQKPFDIKAKKANAEYIEANSQAQTAESTHKYLKSRSKELNSTPPDVVNAREYAEKLRNDTKNKEEAFKKLHSLAKQYEEAITEAEGRLQDLRAKLTALEIPTAAPISTAAPQYPNAFGSVTETEEDIENGAPGEDLPF